MKERMTVLSFLRNYQPVDQQEAADVQQIIEWMKQKENIYERSCEGAHITGSALVVNPETQQILLHRHKKLKRWLQFGGHADGKRNIAQVALKEAQEESGLTDLEFYSNQDQVPQLIDVEIQTIPENEQEAEHLHLDFRYLLLTNSSELPTPAEEESQDLTFFNFEQIESIKEELDTALYRLIHKVKRVILN